jgi:hypothetical protein
MKKPIAMLLAAMLIGGFSTKALSYEGHYWYRGGHYYRDAGWWGLGGFFTGLAVGAYVSSLPPRYETVIIDGAPYYYADGYYYQAGPSGYVVVAPPATQGQAAPSENNVMVYLLGILFGIVMLLCIGLLLKRLLVREGRTASNL